MRSRVSPQNPEPGDHWMPGVDMLDERADIAKGVDDFTFEAPVVQHRDQGFGVDAVVFSVPPPAVDIPAVATVGIERLWDVRHEVGFRRRPSERHRRGMGRSVLATQIVPLLVLRNTEVIEKNGPIRDSRRFPGSGSAFRNQFGADRRCR